jgi:hypothetical protein
MMAPREKCCCGLISMQENMTRLTKIVIITDFGIIFFWFYCALILLIGKLGGF